MLIIDMSDYNGLLPGLVTILMGICILLISIILLQIYVSKKLREFDAKVTENTIEHKMKQLHNLHSEWFYKDLGLKLKVEELQKWEAQLIERNDALTEKERICGIKINSLISSIKKRNLTLIDIDDLEVIKYPEKN
jgi:regulatory protein YycI of two-component signal transduction system YycFG